MKTLKKALALLLVLSMSLSLMSVSVFAADEADSVNEVAQGEVQDNEAEDVADPVEEAEEATEAEEVSEETTEEAVTVEDGEAEATAEETPETPEESEETAEEATDEAEEPTDEVAEPTDEAEEPTDEAEEPTEEAEEPTEEAEEPTDEAEEPTEEVAEPVEEIVEELLELPALTEEELAAQAEAERLAAEEAARLEAERLAAEEAARLEAERLAALERRWPKSDKELVFDTENYRVTVTVPESAFADHVYFRVIEMQWAELDEATTELLKASGLTEDDALLDIGFEDADGFEVEPDAAIGVSIEAAEVEIAEVYHVEDAETVAKVAEEVENVATFEVGSFSLFVVKAGATSGIAVTLDDGRTATQYATLADAVAAASSGDTIILGSGEYPVPSSISKGITITGAGKDKTTLVLTQALSVTSNDSEFTIENLSVQGTGNVSFNGSSNVTISNVSLNNGQEDYRSGGITLYGNGGTYKIENTTIIKAFKAIHIFHTGPVVIDNCYLDSVYPFNCDGSNGDVTVTDSTLLGWTSWNCGASSGEDKRTVSFSDCTFGASVDYGYAYLRPYNDVTFTRCTFADGFEIGDALANLTYTFKSCKKVDTTLNKENILTSNIIDNDDHTNSLTIIIDGGKYSFALSAWSNMAAKIGDDYYDTLAEAIAAVPTDGTQTTITMVGDETIVGNAGVTIAANQNVVLDLNGHTVSQIGPIAAAGYLVKNQGTLTIRDNTDTRKDGTGSGKMTTNATNPDTQDIPSYATNLISNYGTLTIESGYYEQLTNGGYASFVVDNYSGGTANIEGGKLVGNAPYAYVIRMFLNSTTAGNTLNISGGEITGGYSVWMQYPNGNANKAKLNISGGIFNARDGYALYGGGGTRNSTEVEVSITGGTINGTGAWLGTDTAFKSISVTGGNFANLGVGNKGGSKFITGGAYKSTTLFAQLRDESTPILADGYHVYNTGDETYLYGVHEDDWAFNGWTWTEKDGGGYTATANYVYACGAEGRQTVEATVTDATANGVITYTATVASGSSPDGIAHTGTKTVTVPTEGSTTTVTTETTTVTKTETIEGRGAVENVKTETTVTTESTTVTEGETITVTDNQTTVSEKSVPAEITTANGDKETVTAQVLIEVKKTETVTTTTNGNASVPVETPKATATVTVKAETDNTIGVENTIDLGKIELKDVPAVKTAIDAAKAATEDTTVAITVKLDAAKNTAKTTTGVAAYDVKPTVQVGAGTAAQIPNTMLIATDDEPILVRLPVPASLGLSKNDRIRIRHSSEGYPDQFIDTTVLGSSDNLYVEFTVTHFSTFELIPSGKVFVTFDPANGSAATTTVYTEGTTVNVPTVTRDGYMFNGWTPALSATATADVTYTAQWRVIEYSSDDSSSDDDSSGSTAPQTTTIVDETTPLSEFPIFYVDVADNSWYHDAIAYVTALELMNGVGDNHFAPNDNTTRGMVAVVMMRLAGGEAVDLDSFFDVADSAYYAEAAAWAVENGVFKGYDDGSFRGEINITREQFAAVLYRYALAKGYDVSAKADLGAYDDGALVGGYASDAMAWAIANGIIKGVGNNRLDPLGNATRAQLATMLMRFDELTKDVV